MRERKQEFAKAAGRALQGKKLEITISQWLEPQNALPKLVHMIKKEILEVMDENGEQVEDSEDCCWSLAAAMDSEQWESDWECDRNWRVITIRLTDKFGSSSHDWDLLLDWMDNNLDKVRVID